MGVNRMWSHWIRWEHRLVGVVKRCGSFPLPALLLIFLFGCVTSGKKFDSSKVSEIRKGVSTKQDVQATFGEPVTKTQMADGRESWSYDWASAGPTVGGIGRILFFPLYFFPIKDAHVKTKSLQLTFEGDRVADYILSESSQ